MIGNISVTYGNETISAEELRRRTDGYCEKLGLLGKGESLHVSMEDRPSFMTAVLAALERGHSVVMDATGDVVLSPGEGLFTVSGRTVPSEALEDWLAFSDRILEGRNSTWIDDSDSAMQSLTWMTAFRRDGSIIISSTPEDAGTGIMSLAALSSLKEDIPSWDFLITSGCDSLEFDDIKERLAGSTRWINYYGSPASLLVSYGKSMTVQGRRGIYHALKPLAGTSVSVVNEGGAAVPANVSGRLVQTGRGWEFTSPARAVVMTDGTLAAEGLEEGFRCTGGKLMDDRDIYDILMKPGLLRDVMTDGDTIFYTQQGELSPSEVRDILEAAAGDAASYFRYMELPYIPKDGEGRADAPAVEEMTAEARDCRDRVMLLEGEKGVYADIEFRNESVSILQKDAVSSADAAEGLTVTDEDAVLAAPPIDYSLRKYAGLSELIEARAGSDQEILYINTDGQSRQSYRQLYQESRRVASGLLERGVEQGDVLVFQFPDNREFITSYWACIMIGAVIAPLGVLDDYGGRNINTDKLRNICAMLDSYYVIASDAVGEKLGDIVEEDRIIKFGDVFKDTADDFDTYRWDDDETSLLIFTSGSTGNPKGVRLSQGNIFARTLAEMQRYGLDDRDVDLNWMTLTHAAGIIWSHIRDVYLGIFQVQAASEVVLQEPTRILDIMSTYGCTTTWTPNFLFTLIRNNYDENRDYDWDLSPVTHLFVGGEANVSRDFREFIKIGMKYGMAETCVYPSFGMAETSSSFINYDDFRLDNTSDQDRFVPIGAPNNGHIIRITDHDGNIMKKGQIGRIECSGNCVTKGYYKNDEANREALTDDGFLITGDMGYIEGGNCVLTGREKEIIIINGLNYYVQDIEAVVNESPGVIPSYTTAVPVKNESGTEDILVVFSPEDDNVFVDDETLRTMTDTVRKTLLEQSGLYAKYVVPEQKDKSIRTEIGKKQRGKYRRHFEEGLYDEILCKTGIIKDTKYFMEEIWTPESYRGSVRYVEAVERNGSLITLGDLAYIDTFAAEGEKMEHEDFVQALYERAAVWSALPEGSRIIIPALGSLMVKEDDELDSDAALLFGFIQSFGQENPERLLIQVDMDRYSEETAMAEASYMSRDTAVAYRDGKRYTRALRTVTKEDVRSEAPADLRGRTVLLAGGTGGVGRLMARHLVTVYGASLLITGRSPLDDERKAFTDSLGKASYIEADACDEKAMEDAVSSYEEETGNRVDVFIDLAGSLGNRDNDAFWHDTEGHMINNDSREDYMATIDSKYNTSLTLGSMASKREGALLILFGSVNGVLGGTGLAAYSAANSFQNEYARYLRMSGRTSAYCINWSGWYGTGLSAAIPQHMITLSQISGFRFVSGDENLEQFDAIMDCRIGNAVVGLDRDNKRSRCETDDEYRAVLDIYYTGNGGRQKEIAAQAGTSVPARYLEVDEIPYDDRGAVDIRQLRRRVTGVREEEEVLTDTQEKMIELWKKVLHLNKVGLDDDFFGLGGNSLMITKLVYEIENTFDQKINMQDILVKGTVRQLADSLEGTLTPEEERIRENLRIFQEDVKLDFDIDHLLSEAAGAEGDDIMMTGATSFVGAFVLNELVKKYPERRIYCFLKRNSDEEGEDRLSKVLEEYRCREALESDNIIPVTGDLSKENLGMDTDEYDELCRKITAVYHCASNINFIASYEGLRQDNVLSMKRILEFCCTGVKKELNHCSTSAVYRNIDGYARPVVDEKSEFELEYRFQMGYFHSKMAGDIMAQKAAAHGLNVRIFRMGAPSGTTDGGVMQTGDFFWRMLKVVLAIGKFPTLTYFHHEFMPVDIMAKQYVELSALPYDRDDFQFILDSRMMGYKLLREWLEEKFPHLAITDFDEFTSMIREYGRKSQNALVNSLIGPVIDEKAFDRKFPTVDYTHTNDVMRAHGIPVYEDTVESMFENLEITYDYMVSIGFFEDRFV